MTTAHRRKLGGILAASALLLSACTAGIANQDHDESSTSSARGEGGAGNDSPDGEFVPDTGHVDNPFASATMYVNEKWSERVRETAVDFDDEPELQADMEVVANQPTAVWMDRTSAIEGNFDGPGLRHHLDAALEQQRGQYPVVITVVIYNLPGRDCFALASNGELPATDEGLRRYKEEYIDVITQMFAEDNYQDLRIVTVIEPDSLPNLVTNATDPNCQASDPYYRAGVAYTLDAFAPLDNVYTYIDAAHAGWLGWDNNADPTAQLFAEVVRSTTAGFAAVDGFITNTANYTPLVEPYLTNPEHQVGGQPIKASSYYEWNPVFDEISWTANLHQRLVSVGFPSSIGMLIDTSRNGWGGAARPTAASSAADLDTYINQSKVDRRTHRGAWCNQSGAGLGHLPQALPAGYPESHLDAFVWVKPPGESDGSSTEIANDEGKGFDRMCDPAFTSDRLGGRSTNALADAPVSGKWFEAQFVELVRNAFPAVSEPLPAPRTADPSSPDAGAAPEPSSPDSAAEPETVGVPETGCAAVLAVTNSWDGGFQADVSVVAGEQLTGWNVPLVLPAGTKIDASWNTTLLGDSGTVSLSNVDWNGALARGETATVGLTAAGTAPPSGPVPCLPSQNK